MRAQYLRDVTEQGMAMARQMSFLVEQGHDVVLLQSYQTSGEDLTSNLEAKAAKQLAMVRLEESCSPDAGQRGGARGSAAKY